MKWNERATDEKVALVGGVLTGVGVFSVVAIIVGLTFVTGGPLWGIVLLGIILTIGGWAMMLFADDM